jgi:PAS domain S-box-containing protein
MDDRRTILILDDADDDRAIYRRFLQSDVRYTYHILETDQIEEALMLCQQAMPDAILVDFMLPNADGLEFLNQLKLQTGRTLLPVVFLTGQGSEMIAVQVMKSGAQDYLRKDRLTAEVLCRAINSVIERLALLQQLEHSQAQQRLIGEIALRIRQSLKLEEILEAVVTEVRAFLKTDRVIVYQVETPTSGRIVAESVQAEWLTIRHLPIEEPCFAGSLLQAYRQGKRRAIADIHAANLNACHVQLLERFQVQANLVVPILLNRQRATAGQGEPSACPMPDLWGLLIAHQCSSPRDWQPFELNLLDQLAGQAAIAIQQATALYQAQTALADLQSTQATLQKSEALYRAIVEDQTELIQRFLPDTTLTFVNQAYCRYFGRLPEDLSGTSCLSQVPEAEHPSIIQQLTSLSWQTPQTTYEHQVILSTGEVRWQQWTSRAIFDGQGKIVEYQAVGQDITGRKQTETKLKQHQEFLQTVIDIAPNLIFVKDWEGRYLLANKAMAHYYGKTVEELKGLRDADLHFDPEAASQFLAQNQQVIRTQQPLFIPQERQIHPSRGEMWLQWHKQAIYLPESQDFGVLGIGVDITTRIQAEIALQNLAEGTASKTGNDFFPALVRCIAEVFGIRHAIVTERLDQQLHTLAFWSDQQLQPNLSYSLTQTPCEMTLQQGVYHCPDPTQDLFPKVPALAALGAVSYLGVALFDADGNPLGNLYILDGQAIGDRQRFEGILRVFAARASAELERMRAIEALQQLNCELEHWVAERTTELVGTVELLNQEIQERRQAEAALRESEARFRTMADSAPMLLWMAGADGGYNFFNQSWLDFTGRTHEQECNHGWLTGVHPEDVQSCLSTYQAAFAARQEFQMEYRLRRADDEYRWLLDRGKPRFTPEGEFAGYIGSCIDITERKQIEDERQQTAEEIRKAFNRERELNELKSRFVSMISHEFRTPLTTIQSAADLLQHYEWSPEEKQERFQQIHSAVQHMTQLLEEVLVIGKAEAGKLDFRPQRIDLRAFCQKLTADIQLAAGSHHTLSFTSQGPVQDVWIDQKLLRQILTNLVSNAIKYSPGGGIVQLRLIYDVDAVHLQIEDEGIGIPAEDRERVFDAFFRASNVGVVQGTGLGLATVQRCVDLHGGSVAIASELGKGTTFTVTLPLCPPNRPAEPEVFFIEE